MSCAQGMPEAWAKLLLNSGISAAEKKKNPQGVIKALEFYTANSSGINEGETKFMTAQRYGGWALVTVLFGYRVLAKQSFCLIWSKLTTTLIGSNWFEITYYSNDVLYLVTMLMDDLLSNFPAHIVRSYRLENCFPTITFVDLIR